MFPAAGGTLDPTGGLVDKCRDILYVNMFAMGMSLVHENFWWVLVVIPLYMIYKMIASFFDYMLTPAPEVPEEQVLPPPPPLFVVCMQCLFLAFDVKGNCGSRRSC